MAMKPSLGEATIATLFLFLGSLLLCQVHLTRLRAVIENIRAVRWLVQQKYINCKFKFKMQIMLCADEC